MSTRTTKVYSITMPAEMGRQAEQLAKAESRTMSELLREAFRRYQIEQAERRLLADPLRAKHLAELRRLVTELRQEAKQKGLNRITMREIDAKSPSPANHEPRKKALNNPRHDSVVFDTNVLYSAILKPGSVPARVFDLATEGLVIPCVSDDVRAEYRLVLYRPELELHSDRRRELLGHLFALAPR